ncbi:MAG: phage tail sheath subtilisin-like domain-containing protein [Candidatus Methanoperedens sp.]|nr:phage tail sheath subtilisin-like domain-containing protein [Candidatus Methanoperedens sp.]
MPITPTYPGVYIEEIPSGVRTIMGVATSITAFIGRAVRGPVNEPLTINSFGDYERIFGGLWTESTMSYAVRDFYMNGGIQAIIVRLFHPFFATDEARVVALNAATAQAQTAADAVSQAASDAVAGATTPEEVAVAAEAEVAEAGLQGAAALLASTAVAQAARAAVTETATPQDIADAADAAIAGAVSAAAAQEAPRTKAQLTVGGLVLEAASEGTWGNSIRARIDHDAKGPDAANLFNLSLKDTNTGQIEMIRNVSVQTGHTRRVDRVLEQESKLVKAAGTLPGSKPEHSAPDPIGVVTPGQDPFGTSNSTGVTTGIASDGNALDTPDYSGSSTNKQGIYALEKADLFNILCIPPYTSATDVAATLWATAASYCEARRAMLVIDSPGGWNSKDTARGDGSTSGIAAIGTNSKNACVFFPRLRQPNPKREYQVEDFASCGAVAGIFSRTDSQRGVWKAPAGLDATMVGVPQLSVSLTDAENGELNPLGINCLRTMPAVGRVVWGSRTLQGDDRLASEWKYIPVRRTALFIEESLYRGTQWVVFEPNDEPLWAQIRLNLGAFMNSLFRQGAFQGKTPREAYFVKCDRETTTQDDINRGIVNIIVGFAPLKPAEFVIIMIQQIAGQIQT